MTPQERFVLSCVRKCCARLGLKKIPSVQFGTLGRDYQACTWKKTNQLAFDTGFVETVSDYDICTVVIHECCHLKSKIRGHGKTFRKICMRYGADAEPYGFAWARDYAWVHMIRMD
jgi:predicted metal-dependent hydrolase